MIDVKLNMSQFQRAAKEMGGNIDQVPFALSKALNEAAKVTREHLITETWPKSVTVRNRGFMRASLWTEFSDKRNLRVSIYDKLDHGNLKQHAEGGSRIPRGGRLAIPSVNVRRGSSGPVQSQRPRNLRRSVVKGNRIFQAVGRGKSSKLQLMYKLASSAMIKKDVPFHEDFAAVMRREAMRTFPDYMRAAMRTRR